MSAAVDQSDLQGNVLCGYGNRFAHALYAFVHLHDGGEGRRLVGELAAEVTNAVPWDREPPAHTLNVAVSFAGLRALGVPESVLASFPEAFREDMAARAELLGDSAQNDPRWWESGLAPGRPHLLVTVMAQDSAARDRRAAELRERLDRTDGALELVHELPAGLLDHPVEGQFGREHFGFADGLSQPTIADPRAGPWDRPGRGTPRRGGWDGLAPGEFVLGYPDEEGLAADAPAEPLRAGGSYTVVRKLFQDVFAFRRYLREQADEPGGEELLAAKLVGRWHDGTPLGVAPERAPVRPPAADELNDFVYAGDPDGHACPLGSHVRRSNPRDALGWEGRRTRRHRIIRRGMPYGPAPEDPDIPDGRQRGLLFICHQASIERQFEVVQARWISDGDAFGLGDERDPLLSPEDSGPVTIQGRPPTLLPPTPSFVVLRGGGYFFTPGIAALGALADGITL